MTQFNLETTEKITIQSYDEGEINLSVSGNASESNTSRSIQSFNNSFIVTPYQIIDNWRYSSVDELTAESFKSMIEHQPELVILGTGKSLTFPSQQNLQAFHQAGIGIEVMNTASACRTYNVLVAENRFVIAGLLMI